MGSNVTLTITDEQREILNAHPDLKDELRNECWWTGIVRSELDKRIKKHLKRPHRHGST